MSVTNNVYPNTRPEDERIVRRTFGNFQTGMITDVDEASVPSSALCDLDNMRVTKAGLVGRTGSKLFRDVTLPHAFEESIPFTMNGNVIDTGELFFDSSKLGYKMIDSLGNVYFIVGVDEDVIGRITVFAKSYPNVETTITGGYKVWGPINASIVDDLNGYEYYLLGTEIYRIDDETNTFTKCTVFGEQPANAASTFFKINNFVFLSNPKGLFTINPNIDNPYGWRQNIGTPRYKLNRQENEERNYISPSAYNYSYGYTKIKNKYTYDRFEGTDLIERETPPYNDTRPDAEDTTLTPSYLPDMKNNIYTDIITPRPIGKYKYYTLTRSTNATHNSVSYWKQQSSNGVVFYFKITYNGTAYYPTFDFKQSKTWLDVAKDIERSLRYTVGHSLRCKASKVGFEVYSTIDGDSIVFGDDDGVSINGTDMFNSVLTYSNTGVNASNVLKYLRYPPNDSDITHYTLYRSNDIYPHIGGSQDQTDPRWQNLTGFMSLVDDIPVCKVFYGVISSNVLEVSYVDTFTKLDETDVGNTIYYRKNNGDWVSTTITGIVNLALNQFSVTGGSENSTISASAMYFGATGYREVTKTGATLSVDVGAEFTDADVGKIIFWVDGTYSIITAVNGFTTTTFDSVSKPANTPCLTDPSVRVYNDITDDDVITARASDYPMNMAYFTPVPNTNIAAYLNGIVAFAERDKEFIYYSDAVDVERVGYYNAGFQVNNKVQDGIKMLVSVGGNFAIMTDSKTFVTNTQQTMSGGDPRLGERYTIMPDPVMIANGIGSTHQSKYTQSGADGIVMVTNEPGLRIFDGSKYSDDLSDGFIKRVELSKLDSAMIVSCDNSYGVTVWGKGV